jgi:preprotein translocase subunit YajC
MYSFLLFFQDTGSGGGLGLIGMLAPFAVIFGIFYFLVIVPQKRQKQQLQEMITALKINDEIVTNGGIIGKVKEIRESSFIIVSADKSFLEIGKSAVVGRKPEAGQQ